MSSINNLEPTAPERQSLTNKKINELVSVNNTANSYVKRASYKFITTTDQAVLLNDTLATFDNFNYSGTIWLRRTSGSQTGSMLYTLQGHTVEKNSSSDTTESIDLTLVFGVETDAYIRCGIIGDTAYIKTHPRDGEEWETIFDITIFHGNEYLNIRLET